MSCCCGDDDQVQNAVDKYFPENVAEVIDGQHRRHMLMLDDVRATNGDIVLEKLYTRKDGHTISKVDCLWLGHALNHTAALVRAMSPLDHVYAGLSLIKVLRGSANPGPANATVRDLLQT